MAELYKFLLTYTAFLGYASIYAKAPQVGQHAIIKREYSGEPQVAKCVLWTVCCLLQGVYPGGMAVFSAMVCIWLLWPLQSLVILSLLGLFG